MADDDEFEVRLSVLGDCIVFEIVVTSVSICCKAKVKFCIVVGVVIWLRPVLVLCSWHKHSFRRKLSAYELVWFDFA